MTVLAGSVAPAEATALAFGALRNSQKDLITYLFGWQPALIDGLEGGLLVSTDHTAAVVHELTGLTMSPPAILDRITRASTYIDDARWSETVSKELGLPVRLTTRSFAARFGATLSVGSGVDLLGDARVVEVVRRAMAYRGTDGCIVKSAADRLSIQVLDTFAAKIGDRTVESDDVVTIERLNLMVAAGPHSPNFSGSTPRRLPDGGESALDPENSKCLPPCVTEGAHPTLVEAKASMAQHLQGTTRCSTAVHVA